MPSSTVGVESPADRLPSAPVGRLQLAWRTRAVNDWLALRWLTLLTGVAASIPIIVSAVRGVSEGWVPYGDRAVIAVRSFDVLTSHPPLLGQYSAWSTILPRPIFSPGPLLYWLLAIPAHFMAPAAMPVWIGLVNVGAVVGIVLLARRRGGQPLMFATAIAVVLMCRSLTSETFHDIWDPSSPLLPLTLLFYLAWSVACGAYRLLPLAALVFSFVVQTHLAFLVPSLGLLIVALIGLASSRGYVPRRLRTRTASSAPAVRPAAEDSRALKRWTRAAIVICVVCWIPPLINQVFRLPGNLFLIAKAVAARGQTLGWAEGWHALVHAIGVPPWWLGSPVGGPQRFFQVVGNPGFGAQASCVVILMALAGALVVALRRRRVDVASAAAIALLISLTLGLETASVPTGGLLALTLGYTLWWGSPAGMFVWLALGWSVATLSGLRLWRTEQGWARLVSPAALVGVTAVAVAVVAAQGPDIDRGEYRPFGEVDSRLASALPHPGTVLVTADASNQGFELQAEVVYALERQGATVLLPRYVTTNLGSSFVLGRRHYDHRVAIAFDHPPTGQGRVIAQVRVNPPAPAPGTFTVTLQPAR